METEAQPETRESALGNAILLRVMKGRNERLMNEMVAQGQLKREEGLFWERNKIIIIIMIIIIMKGFHRCTTLVAASCGGGARKVR